MLFAAPLLSYNDFLDIDVIPSQERRPLDRSDIQLHVLDGDALCR